MRGWTEDESTIRTKRKCKAKDRLIDKLVGLLQLNDYEGQSLAAIGRGGNMMPLTAPRNDTL